MAHGSELNSIIEAILESLFGQEDRRIDMLVERLNQENNLLIGKPVIGFLFQGNYYKPKGAPASRDREMLHHDLLGKGHEFLGSYKKVLDERQRVKQSLFLLLHPCRTMQDIRDALPDCLQDMIGQEIRNLPRSRPEAFTIIGNERAMAQFITVKPTMEFYSVARLLY